MVNLGTIIEPILPISVFTFGFFANTGPSIKKHGVWNVFKSCGLKRFIAEFTQHFPFTPELLIIIGLFIFYELARAGVKLISGGRETAIENAELVVYLETVIHLGGIEKTIQGYFLDRPWLISLANHFYKQTHWTSAAFFLVFVFTFYPKFYSFYQRWFVISNLLAFVVFILFPCAPPRLLPNGGWIDTIRKDGDYNLGMLENPLVNAYAAMPSMHFGYCLLFSFGIYWLVTAHRKEMSEKEANDTFWYFVVGMILVVLYPVFMLFSIVATGNHYFLDAVAGAIDIWIGYYLSTSFYDHAKQFLSPFFDFVRDLFGISSSSPSHSHHHPHHSPSSHSDLEANTFPPHSSLSDSV